MNLAISLLIFNLLNSSGLGNSFELKSYQEVENRFYLSTSGLPEIIGYNKLTHTLIFQSIKPISNKIEGLIKNITPIIQAKAYSTLLETYNITNINQVVLFVHSP